MSVEVEVAKLICEDIKKGNIIRLQEWVESYPDFQRMLNEHVSFDALSYSIDTHNWRLLRFMLDHRDYPTFSDGVEQAMESEHALCSKIVTANIHRNPSRVHEVLVQLTETWRWK